MSSYSGILATPAGSCVDPRTVSSSAHTQDNLQERLTELIDNTREMWTYAIFWQQSDDTVLGWGDGYYKGQMANAKTKSSSRSSAEQRHRKKVLLELSLIFGDPAGSEEIDEDVTDPEWYFLISMTQSFIYGNGLPGEAMSYNRQVCIVGREQLLASHCEHTRQGQDFGMQTVVYIPCTNGVIELGSTELFSPSISLIMNMVGGLFGVIQTQQDLTPMACPNGVGGLFGVIQTQQDLTPMACPNGVVELGSTDLLFGCTNGVELGSPGWFFNSMNELKGLFDLITNQTDLTPIEADQADGGGDSDPSKGKCKTAEISLPREVIEKQFGKTMKEAAKTLNVSISTFKRKLRKHNIKEWQGPKRKRSDSSTIRINTIEENNVQDQSVDNINKNMLTIKAEYVDDMIKFSLPTSQATFATVEKEISMKFKLILGTYKLKYLDEDGDWISLRSDAEMSDCIKSSTKSDRIVIRLRVVPSP